MPFFKEQKDNLEFQFEKPNVNFLVDEQSEAVKLYKLIKKLDFSELYKRYSDQGAVAYRPEVLFAILILGALEGILSSRAIEKKCIRDVYFIYFTEYRKPDHSTIARFLKKFRKEIFGLLPQLIRLAKENKMSTFSTIAIDGSKFQSSGSKKHSMKMNTLEKEEKFIIRKIEKLLNLLEENDKKENRDEKAIKKLEEERNRLEIRKQRIEESKKELARRQKEIKDKENRENHQINIIEPDARMMKEINANGYNVQLSVDTESEIIINATVEADRSDNHQFSKQHQNTVEILGEDEQREYLADGGYMSTETIDYVEEAKVNAYINDSREVETIPEPEKLLERGKAITSEFFTYSKGTNEYSCPNQRQLKEIKPGVYESENCSGCIIKHLCARKNKLRRVTRTEFTERKELMREKIKQSPEKMNQRKAVERVFGNIKWNLGFRRFSRKGFEGASIEIMMIVLALNLKKMGRVVLFPEKLVQTGLFLLIDLLIGLHRKYKLSLRTVC
ncbi:MAG TPA: IS1182 family transposase [Ignavibacteriaceae bacterium]|nr:IS1182 family transposase [Ignavibacteriaceae bacterium]